MYAHKITKNKIETHLIDENLIDKEIIFTKEMLLSAFTEMLKLRVLEEESYKNYDKMRGFLHLTIGQESVYIAILQVLQKEILNYDFIGSYRCHSLAYITGSSINEIVCELLGKEKGMCKGKGGSMHLYNKNFYGGHGIVGAQIPLGTGLAFAIKYKNEVLKINDRKAVFCFFGDGASNQGQIYESYNIALVHKLPIVYVIENNRFGMWTKIQDVSVSDNFFKRWSEMRGIRVKSNSLFAISSVIKNVIEMVKNGPIILQIDTYRHCGHAMNDEQKYRNEEEKEKEINNDCIEEVLEKLIQMGCEEECEKIENDIKKEIEDAFLIGTKEKLPNEKELFTDIIN
ncbi:hypothetical protein GVAV_002980 [Gurleya vavrai]